MSEIQGSPLTPALSPDGEEGVKTAASGTNHTFHLGNVSLENLAIIQGFIGIFTDPLYASTVKFLKSGDAAITIKHGSICVHATLSDFSNN